MTPEFQSHFIDLLEKSATPAHSIDENGRIVCVSDGWLTLLMYERVEVIGRKSIDFLTKDSQKTAVTALTEFYKTGEVRNIEYTFVKKSGDLVKVLLNAKSVREDTGEFIRSTAVLTPVSFLKETNGDINVWISRQTTDVQLLLTNLNVKILDVNSVVIDCPNVHWFGIITALKNKFRCISSLELSASSTGDFQIVEIPGQSPRNLEPISKLAKLPQIETLNHSITH